MPPNRGKTWILLDVACLAYRAFYTTGGLAYGGEGTGVAYGVLRDILNLRSLFATGLFAFAFDSPASLRRDRYADYKADRKKRGTLPEAAGQLAKLRSQVSDLRIHHLPALGYRNLYYQDGYEADDLLAAAVAALPSGDHAVIVTTDTDLYQLLSVQVVIWNPLKKEEITEQNFTDYYGVPPRAWVDVLAIAGCPTDNVTGVRNVGPRRAADYVAGRLSPSSAAYRRIVVEYGRWSQNYPLVRLPYPGTLPVVLVDDREGITSDKWDLVFQRLGIRSLAYAP